MTITGMAYKVHNRTQLKLFVSNCNHNITNHISWVAKC